MGQPKMLLPWGRLTVIERVITTFVNAGIKDIVVVTGGTKEQVQKAIEAYPVQTVHNPDFVSGEMVSSLQRGLRALPNHVQATLIALGDQPQLQEESVRAVCAAYQERAARLVVPSFQMRRGHPWMVARPLWDEILTLEPPESPRDFLNKHADEIHYVNLNTPSVLADLDTPEDYQQAHP